MVNKAGNGYIVVSAVQKENPVKSLLRSLGLAAVFIYAATPAFAAPGALTIKAAPVAGHNAVDITVTGPAQVPVDIVSTATIDPDLPTVTLSRKHYYLGADGKLQDRITLAPNYWEGSRVTITASSIDGVTPASVTVKVLRANPTVPGDKN